MITEPFALFVAISAVIALAHGIAARSKLAERIGITQLVIFSGLLLGNVGVVTQTDDAYDMLSRYVVPLSIALLLFRLDLRELRTLKAQHLLFFLIGSACSVIGGLVAFFLFGDRIGPDAGRLTGQLVASYIGGGENSVAVAKAVEVPTDLFTAAFAADNVVTALWMMIGLSAPFGFSRFFSTEMPQEQILAAREHSQPVTSATLIPNIVYALALAGGILIASIAIAKPIRAFAEANQIQWLRFNTTILWVTTFALLVAQTPLRRVLNVSYSLGMLLFYYFFFYMGAVSSIQEIVRFGPAVFVFVATIVAVHGALILAAGKLSKADLATIFVCSQANIGGPSTAVALAEANGWYHMVTPAILLGILGYAIANYIGLFLAQALTG
ncbi:MAG: DUF819 family protein [Deltaproteobacteria bacterium]|nr:DUF819 family protein [Deltaproteobacteria bacterium]